MTLAEQIQELAGLRAVDWMRATIADFAIQTRYRVLTLDEGAADLGSDLLGLLGFTS